jgi:hypothetical protein
MSDYYPVFGVCVALLVTLLMIGGAATLMDRCEDAGKLERREQVTSSLESPPWEASYKASEPLVFGGVGPEWERPFAAHVDDEIRLLSDQTDSCLCTCEEHLRGESR